MSFNYIITTYPVQSVSLINEGIASQNRDWIEEKLPFRLESVGKNKFILTGLFEKMRHIVDLKIMLWSFLRFVEYEIDIEQFEQISLENVKDYYEKLKFKTRAPNNLNDFPLTEQADFYKDLKVRYYHYNLENLLSQSLQKKYSAYMRKVVQSPLSTKQLKIFKDRFRNINLKMKVTGIEPLPLHWDKNTIVIGRYHISKSQSKVMIPAYGKPFPEIQTRIENFAFDGWNNLKVITISSDIDYFGRYAFRECINLQEVAFNFKMASIPDGSFVNCKALCRLEIPSTVTYIGESAFYNCSSLESIGLSNSNLQKIDYDAFYNCHKLETVDFPETLFEINNHAFANSGLVRITLPNSIFFLGRGAFQDCRKLENAVISTELSCIPWDCFQNCINLSKISLPAGKLESISDYAFENCYKLTKVIIPEGVQKIGRHVFRGAGIKHLELPTSLIEMDDENDFGEITEIKCKKNSSIAKYLKNKVRKENWNVVFV